MRTRWMYRPSKLGASRIPVALPMALPMEALLDVQGYGLGARTVLVMSVLRLPRSWARQIFDRRPAAAEAGPEPGLSVWLPVGYMQGRVRHANHRAAGRPSCPGVHLHRRGRRPFTSTTFTTLSSFTSSLAARKQCQEGGRS